MIDLDHLRAAHTKARADLLSQRVADGHWVGQLSASALSTATAISALAIARREAGGSRESDAAGADERLINAGIRWILDRQNRDGGWGDTDKSHSNLATTMLVTAAIHLAGRAEALAGPLASATAYVEQNGGIEGLRARYGADKTFAIPILTNCALAGLVDWAEVSPLPFELACIPQRCYRWARMPVVSYAIPALVAIGQARFFHCRPRFPITRLMRRVAIGPSLRVLRHMQPESGGYLEATPLTSFVVMSLAATGRLDHPVTQNGLRFLRDSARNDGSWPIDTDLATWNTSLAINALSVAVEKAPDHFALDWLLGCQHRVRHPYTGADPGGWGWTNLSGAVPDADDTAGALLALRHWHDSHSAADSNVRRVEQAVGAGVTWLLNLQNRDGGWPTFCRGWGKLPFDRSGADLTAHAMRALGAWRDVFPDRVDRALARGWRFLARHQRSDGSWIPLWFGHQDHPHQENPVVGTARVLLAYGDLEACTARAARRGAHWLESVQQPDGGWRGDGDARGRSEGGAASGVEETALAVEALIGMGDQSRGGKAVEKGLGWLIDAVLANRHRETAPIGFYFAKLWYHERLYPLVFAVAALGQGVRRFGNSTTHSGNAHR